MLREGWDVQNVTVMVGLRPYTSKANILPEQTIGRGLRLMFRGEGTGYTERVDVIGNADFMEFVDQLEKEEELKLETCRSGRTALVIRRSPRTRPSRAGHRGADALADPGAQADAGRGDRGDGHAGFKSRRCR